MFVMKKFAVAFLLILGVLFSVFLAQRRQTFQSKAYQSILSAFTFSQVGSDGQKKPVFCTENTCDIESAEIEVRVDIDLLEQLLKLR